MDLAGAYQAPLACLYKRRRRAASGARGPRSLLIR